MRSLLQLLVITALALLALTNTASAQQSTPDRIINQDIKGKICKAQGQLHQSTFLLSRMITLYAVDVFELYSNKNVLEATIAEQEGNPKLDLNDASVQMLAWIEYGSFAFNTGTKYVGDGSAQLDKLMRIRADLVELFETLVTDNVKGLSLDGDAIENLSVFGNSDNPIDEYFNQSRRPRSIPISDRRIMLTPVLGLFGHGLTSNNIKEPMSLSGCSHKNITVDTDDDQQNSFLLVRPQPEAENKDELGVRKEIAKKQLSKLAFVLRGKADDIAVPATDQDKFKKLDNATISYAKNFLAKTTNPGDSTSETIKANIYLGLGKSFGSKKENYLYGFVGYQRDTTDTQLKESDTNDVVEVEADDPEFIEDISALSIGSTYARQFGEANDLLYGDVGFTAYYTRDFAQKSKMIKGRLFVNDLTFSGLSTTDGYCINGIPIDLSVIYVGCRVDTFVELSHIINPGFSEDFDSLDDDHYFGLGGEMGLIFGFNESFLSDLTFSVKYRYLNVVSGSSSNISLFKAKASYAIKKTPFLVDLWYEEGENFDTFQPLESLNLGVGLKF